MDVISENNMNDREGLKKLLKNVEADRSIPKITWADMGYEGAELVKRISRLGVSLEIAKHRMGICKDTLQLKPLSKDYE